MHGGGEADDGLNPIVDSTEKTSENDEQVLKVPIRVLETEDLAFYSTVLGKEY
jgi:hypothetical protein